MENLTIRPLRNLSLNDTVIELQNIDSIVAVMETEGTDDETVSRGEIIDWVFDEYSEDVEGTQIKTPTEFQEEIQRIRDIDDNIDEEDEDVEEHTDEEVLDMIADAISEAKKNPRYLFGNV